jgi:hypothetical protein
MKALTMCSDIQTILSLSSLSGIFQSSPVIFRDLGLYLVSESFEIEIHLRQQAAALARRPHFALYSC